MRRILTLLFCLPILCSAQTSLTLSASKDAVIRELNGVGDGNNYGTAPYLNMHAWTNIGNTAIQRALIDFDLSMIPSNATIQSAYLFLFVDMNVSTFPGGHQQLSGSNESIIKRVIANWNELLVTWNNQPGTTTLNQTTIPQSTASNQDYIIDVTNLVQDMINDTINSFGFYMKLINENYYRRMIFASKDNPDPELHPRLHVTYLPDSTSTNIDEINKWDKNLLKITNIIGKETPHKKNTILFYNYDDGTVEKRIIIE